MEESRKAEENRLGINPVLHAGIEMRGISHFFDSNVVASKRCVYFLPYFIN